MSYQIEKQWYVVNTYSGHENKVKDNLEKRIETQNMHDIVFRVVVAEYEVTEERPVTRKGEVVGTKTVTKTKNMYPGYIFIEMIMTDEAWYMVRNTPGVTGFTGSSGGGAKPFPVTREQIEPVLKRMGMFDSDMYSDYNVGDLVKVLDGSFKDTEGNIISIDTEVGEVTLSLMFFGRNMEVTVKFSEIEKVQ